MCDTLRSPQMQLRTSAAVKSEKLSRPLEVSVMVGPSGEWFSEIFCVSQLTKQTNACTSISSVATARTSPATVHRDEALAEDVW